MKTEFCDGPLWDKEFWSDQPPVLTPCFENTVLVYLPTLFMMAGGPLYLYIDRTDSSKGLSMTILNLFKIIACIALILVHAYGVFFILYMPLAPASYLIAEVLQVLNFMMALLIIIVDRSRGKGSSALLSIFWFLTLLCQLPIYYRYMLTVFGQSNAALPSPEDSEYIVWSVAYPLVFLEFLLAAFSEVTPERKKDGAHRNPIYSASPVSKVFFGFFTSLIILGYRKTLSMTDLPPPMDSMTSDHCYQKWSDTVKAYEKKGKKVGLTRSCLKTYWALISLGWVAEVGFVAARASAALLLNQLILFMSNDDPMWKGYIYSGGIFVIYICSAVLIRWGDYLFVSLGLNIKAVLTGAIYRKSLKITGTHLGKYTVGELVNLLSVDADKIKQFSFFVGVMIGCPFNIAFSIGLLWQFLGPSCLAGIAVIFVMMPLTGTVAALSKKVQEKQMALKDSRLKYISEILSSIKIIKFYAWEPPFMDRVRKVRFGENVLLKKFAYIAATLKFFWSVTPFMVSLFAFLAYVLIYDLTMIEANVAFVSLSLFNSMRFSLAVIPDVVANAVQVLVSIRRIEEFLDGEELEDNLVGSNPGGQNTISWKDASLSWSAENEGTPALKDINIDVKAAELIAVVGRVGSGKSSLISSLLGDLMLIKGTVDLIGGIAYVPQQAWIQNATIKNNILFTTKYDKHGYRKVIDNCCLKTDLDILPGGEQTEIGEKGVNLSGGQKQRISLARAVYQNKDIYLLDDPLSAVDAHVGAALFKNIIGNKGMLKGKTRVFVTNMLSVLPEVDRIVVMQDGSIVEEGTYKELIGRTGVFSEFLKEHAREKKGKSELKEEAETATPLKYVRTMSVMSDESGLLFGEHTDNKLIADEYMESGAVKWSVYRKYLSKIGWPICIIALIGGMGARTFDIMSGIWLSAWSTDDPGHEPENYTQRTMRIIIYAVLGFLYGLFSFMGTAALVTGTITAARKLHNIMLNSVLRAPMSFFDTTPLGRLLNRFGKDIDQLDIQLPQVATTFLEFLFQLLGLLILIGFNVPIFLAICLPVLCVYIFIQRLYMVTLRQIKRIESVTRSPVYNHFSETLNGLSSIRAYGVQDRFIGLSDEKVDITQNCSMLLLIGDLWLGTRLDITSNLIVLSANVLLVIQKGIIDAGTAGFIASYAMGTTFAFNFIVHYASEVESAIVASERIEEYADIKSEAAWIVEPRPAIEWPDDGAVRFEKYSTRYREGLELVLKDIDLSINPGEKVGIVGRTGAGKSSLTLCLFRIIEAATGRLKIDDVDISRVGLHDLRSRLTIIPQDPVIFSGSLRLNLDPNGIYPDDSLWTALERAHVKSQFSQGLEFEIAEGGNNLSVGQRQLICLARAILSKKKILVMDEATAAVDLETDALIQSTIRQDFSDCTIITIAHRLNTILDSDRVVVMAKGEVIEEGPPNDLLKDPTSEFYSMAKEAGIVDDQQQPKTEESS